MCVGKSDRTPYIDRPVVCYRRATQSLLQIRKSYDRFLNQRSKAFEARRRRAGGRVEVLVSNGGG